jgi:type IV secretion system protein VirB2
LRRNIARLYPALFRSIADPVSVCHLKDHERIAMLFSAVLKSIAYFVLTFSAAMVWDSPAYAQLSNVNNLLQNIESVLKGAGVTIASIAIIVSGYKIIFQGARFEDVSKILIGGLLIGGATSLAGWLIGAAA